MSTETVPVLEAVTPRRNTTPTDSIRAMLAPPAPAVETPASTKTIETKEIPAAKINEADPKAEAIKAPVIPEKDEAEDFLKGVTEKSRSRFNELATKRGQKLAEELAIKRAEEIVAKKLAEMPKADPEAVQKLEAAQKRSVELETELRKLGVERSPEFQAKFVERPKAIKTELGSILEDSEVSKDDFFQHLDKYGDKASKAKLNELLESIGPLDRAEAFSLIQEYLKIDKDKLAVTTNPEAAEKVLRKEHEDRTKAFVEKLGAERKSAVSATVPVLRKEAAALFEGDTGEAFGRDFDAKFAQTNDLDLEQFPAPLRAQLIGSALLTKPLIAKVNEQQERIAELQAQVDGFQKKTPGIGTGRSVPAAREEVKDVLSTAEDLLGFRAGSMPRNRKNIR